MDKRCFEVEPGLLYGRPGPATTQWNLPYLRAQGLGVVVSLVRYVDGAEIADAGLIHYSLPFEDKLHVPYVSANQFLYPILERFDEILDQHLLRREPILVHCNAGKDRTGLLLAYYLLTRKRLRAKNALKRIRKLKPDALTANGFEDGFYAMADVLIEKYESRSGQ